MRHFLPALALVALTATACGSDADTVAADPTSSPSPATQLQIEVLPAPGAEPLRWTLTCDPAGGDHPAPEQACADLAEAEEPFAPIPDDVVCTEVYGGPQTATVRGTYRGEPVDLELARTNGCEIAQWDSLGAVLSPDA